MMICLLMKKVSKTVFQNVSILRICVLTDKTMPDKIPVLITCLTGNFGFCA